MDDGEPCAVDFNAVIPMPESLSGDSASVVNDWAMLATGMYPLSFFQRSHANPGDSARSGNWGAAADALHVSNVLRLLDQGPFPKDFDDAQFAMFLKRIQAIKETGFVSWYEWSIEKWGTKWNAYDIGPRTDTTVRFNTAWSAPLPVVVALSKKFPNDDIRLRWADEDTGANTGVITFKNGEVVSGGKVENYSHEAYSLYLELHCDGVMPDYLEWVDGVLKYKEEEESEV